MLRLFRRPVRGEFFVVFGDCAQGGIDSNFAQFLSKDRVDVPLVLQMQGVAASMTPILHQTLEWLFDVTGVQPVVALERNMGGASEMERLRKLNRLNKYRIYIMKSFGKTTGERQTQLLGWNTDSASRPRMLGDLKEAIDSMQLTVYDEVTVSQLKKFIVTKAGRPEAAANAHDDGVMSLAGVYQLYQTETKITLEEDEEGDVRTGNITSLWV